MDRPQAHRTFVGRLPPAEERHPDAGAGGLSPLGHGRRIGQGAPEQVGEARLDADGVGTLSWPDHGAIPVRVEAMDAPRMVSYRWSNDDAAGDLPVAVDEQRSSVFTFTLEAVAHGTELTVVETGFETTSDPLGNLESHRGGWDSELDELVAYLETPA